MSPPGGRRIGRSGPSRDDTGVTCRRWNWRQAWRTQLTDSATAALFILDALAPLTDEALQVAADDLVTHLRRLGPDVQVAQRLLSRSGPPPALLPARFRRGPSRSARCSACSWGRLCRCR